MERPNQKKPSETERKDSSPNRPVPGVPKNPPPGGGQRTDQPQRPGGHDRSAPGREQDPNRRF
jgi:hypothetical protein